jgi:cbb3-type cytochrome oxidase subunit 1
VPRLSVLMLRAALIYLVTGYALGALMLGAGGLHLGSWTSRLRPVHLEFLLLGWTVQLALGVAYWILPRFRAGEERGGAGLAWLAFGLLNGGVLVAAGGGAVAAPAVTLGGRAAEALAAALFARHAWPRIKAFGKR